MTELGPGQLVRVGQVVVLALPRSERPVDVVLGPREQQAALEFRAWPLRDAEWRAGRQVAKEVLRLGFDVLPAEAELVAAESGAPELWLRGQRHPEVTVSISHTTHWAVAAAAPHPVGVDVADDEDGARLPRIARRVFSDGEAEACGAHDSVANQAAVWALKEAALKLRIGGVFSPGARSIRVLALDPPRLADPTLAVAVFRLKDAALALAWEQQGDGRR